MSRTKFNEAIQHVDTVITQGSFEKTQTQSHIHAYVLPVVHAYM